MMAVTKQMDLKDRMRSQSFDVLQDRILLNLLHVGRGPVCSLINPSLRP